MRENRTCSLSGGRWPARKRATSDPTPMNQPNKEGPPSAEAGEERAQTGENIVPSHMHPTQSGKRMSQGLNGVRQVAQRRKQERFTALLHHLTVDLLRESFFALKRKAAPGVDGVTWQEYETGLEDRLVDLHSRVHRGAYRAKPSRRVYIPKPDGRQRPLGIATLEDKLVQQAAVTILNQIYEVDFQGFSYGFRPGRSPHQALDALYDGHSTETRELDFRRRHSGLFRQCIARLGLEVRRASRGRSPHASPDPKMVEGGDIGGRPVVGDGAGYAARGSGFSAALERVSTLHLRFMGRSLAQESGTGRCDCRPLCRRSC